MDDNQSEFDFSHLPIDALHVVFQHVFAPSAGDGPGLPLSTFLARWQAIRLTCKHWNEMIVAHPPPLHLDVSTLPETWLAWLATFPVRTLRIQAGIDEAWCLGPDSSLDESSRAQLKVAMRAPLTASHLVSGLEGAGLPQPFWSLAPFTQLQHLHLQAPVSSLEQPSVFDSAAVQHLEHLEELSLGDFTDFKLDHLPGSLRRLRLRYDSQTRTLSVPQLPDQLTSLDVLQLSKPGALGLCVDDVWGRVAELCIWSHELLLGVPVDDPRLIATFEKPYREGNFVPPHIWGDEEADDRSKQAAELAANHLLTCLPSAARLQRLHLAGGAAASAKFMPVRPHARDSLKWLWSVVRLQGMHNLYGLSGREMEARQMLFEDQLRFEFREQDGCCINIRRQPQLGQAGPPADVGAGCC